MGKNIVVLSGSPRKGGSTDVLTSSFIGGAESAGSLVNCFRVADMRIGACLGCRHCRKEPGVCIQKDDMGTVLSALLKADAVALTSPLYYYGVSAQLKLALDRTYAILRRDTSIRRAALLMTCGAAESDAADAAVLMFRKIAALQKWEEAGIVIAPRLHEPEEIKGRPELEQARLLGRKI